MADSKQEATLKAVETALASTSGVSGRVYRNTPAPKNRDKLPFIVIRPRLQRSQGEHIPRINWEFYFHVIVVGRGEESDAVIDPIINSLYGLLMADRTLGGKVLDLRPEQIQWNFEAGDGENCAAIYEWRAQFQTTDASMES